MREWVALALTPPSPSYPLLHPPVAVILAALYTWMSVAASVAMCCCVTCAQGRGHGDVHLSVQQPGDAFKDSNLAALHQNYQNLLKSLHMNWIHSVLWMSGWDTEFSGYIGCIKYQWREDQWICEHKRQTRNNFHFCWSFIFILCFFPGPAHEQFGTVLRNVAKLGPVVSTAEL